MGAARPPGAGRTRSVCNELLQRNDRRIHHLGATLNPSLITGLNSPYGIAVSGSDLFVTNYVNGTIGEYTTSGATVNASLIKGLPTPVAIAVSGSDLFVSNYGIDAIGEYTTSGATVNAFLIPALNQPQGIAVVPVPEPSTALLLSTAIVGLAVRRRRARSVSRGERAFGRAPHPAATPASAGIVSRAKGWRLARSPGVRAPDKSVT